MTPHRDDNREPKKNQQMVSTNSAAYMSGCNLSNGCGMPRSGWSNLTLAPLLVSGPFRSFLSRFASYRNLAASQDTKSPRRASQPGGLEYGTEFRERRTPATRPVDKSRCGAFVRSDRHNFRCLSGGGVSITLKFQIPRRRKIMRILKILEKTVAISSPISNAYIDFSKMTCSVVAVVTDIVQEVAPVIGYGFNSNGRYGQGSLIRERFRARILDADPKSLIDDKRRISIRRRSGLA